MRTVKVRILPPQPILLILLELFSFFLTISCFLTIEQVYEPSRAILYGIASLSADDVRVNS